MTPETVSGLATCVTVCSYLISKPNWGIEACIVTYVLMYIR